MTHVDHLELSESHDELSELSQPTVEAAVVQTEPVGTDAVVEAAASETAEAPANETAEASAEVMSVEALATDAVEPRAAISADMVVEAPDEALTSEAPVADAVEPPVEVSTGEVSQAPVLDDRTSEPAQAIETAAEPETLDVAVEIEPASDTAKAEEASAPQTPEERVESLETEVNAAPHKVYSLGKARRVLTELKAAEAPEALIGRLDALEAAIRTQISERKAAKEAICEQAEALQESSEWRATGDKMRGLFDEWKQIGGAGKKLDDQLWQRFIAAREHFSTRRTEHFDERQKVWAAAKEKKEALIAQAEALASSTEWRSTADKIRNLQDQWKQAGSAGREADDALWKRFSAAKDAFFDNRTAIWDANKQEKEALCREAEALKDSSDWRLTGDAMKAMQTRWKEIGTAGKAAEDQLWDRFRAATNAFFERREGAFAGRRQDERENLAKKQELVAKIEALVYASDGPAATREAKELQAQWKAVGHANREQSDALWTRFRGACDRIFEAASSERDRQQTEWQGRMKDAMTRKREQLAATRESIEHDEANLDRWRVSLSEMRPSGKSAEIEASLDGKILDVINRIRAKQDRVEELRATITDMEAKLRD